MFSTLSARLCVLAALLILAAVCKANQLKENELAQRLADADLVVVGTVEELLECGARQVGECSPPFGNRSCHGFRRPEGRSTLRASVSLQ
jgi:hypothetical protein